MIWKRKIKYAFIPLFFFKRNESIKNVFTIICSNLLLLFSFLLLIVMKSLFEGTSLMAFVWELTILWLYYLYIFFEKKIILNWGKEQWVMMLTKENEWLKKRCLTLEMQGEREKKKNIQIDKNEAKKVCQNDLRQSCYCVADLSASATDKIVWNEFCNFFFKMGVKQLQLLGTQSKKGLGWENVVRCETKAQRTKPTNNDHNPLFCKFFTFGANLFCLL